MQYCKYMRTKLFKSQAGFTMLELIIVFAIIGILATFLLGGNFINSQRRARDTARKTDLSNIAKALELYFNDYTTYPASNAQGQILGCGAAGDQVCDWGEAWTGAGTTVYLSRMPEDTSPGRRYYYEQVDSGLGWNLYARLEVADDKSLVPGLTVNCYTGDDSECNYRISGGSSIP